MLFNHTMTPPSSYRRPLYLPLHFGLPQWLKEPQSARLREGSKPSQGLWTWPQMSHVGPLLFPASPAPLRPLEETPLDTGLVPLKWTQRSRSWTPLGQTPTHTLLWTSSHYMEAAASLFMTGNNNIDLTQELWRKEIRPNHGAQL